MKKSLVYMGILVFLFGSAMSIAGEIDWDEYFEDPCTHERLDSVYESQTSTNHFLQKRFCTYK